MISKTFNDHPYSSEEIKQIVIMIRHHRYNHNLKCGAYSASIIRKHLKTLNIQPLPSSGTIGRILKKYGLTFKRTGIY